MKRTVVITGMGAISPLGGDLETTWRAMLRGESGVRTITLFDASAFPCRIAAEVKAFDVEMWSDDRQRLESLSRGAGFGLAATRMAMADAGITPAHYPSERIGVFMGSGGSRPDLESLCFAYHAMGRSGGGVAFPAVNPLSFVKWSPQGGANAIARLVGVRGTNYVSSTACASSSQAIGTALRAVQRGEVDLAIAGGYDSMISEIDLVSFSLLGALSTKNEEPEKASRPFDRKRDGFIIGEGAAVLMLEEASRAHARKARIYGELAGFGSALNTRSIVDLAPDGSGAVEAMERALGDASLLPTDIDYINAHGTSTPNNDASETAAIRRVFGEYARSVPISSTKSMTGHLIATAGALEMAVCVLSLRDGMIPPTINYEYPDPKCNLNYVPNRAIKAEVKAVLSNSFAFGGSNSCLIARKYEGIQ